MGITMTEHHLKTLPEYFEAVRKGVKTFEVRKFDRLFRVGDILILNEYDPIDGHTGEFEVRQITYILDGGQFGLEEGYCILAMQPYKLED
jgi:hypothetical protein